MPAGPDPDRRELTHEQRKYLLVLACACDRLELALAHATPPPTLMARVLALANSGPWLDMASSVITPFLPRKLRVVLLGLRMWRGSKGKT